MLQQQGLGVLKLGRGTPRWFVGFDPRFAALAKCHQPYYCDTLRLDGTDALSYLLL
jgi:hypothetical protein